MAETTSPFAVEPKRPLDASYNGNGAQWEGKGEAARPPEHRRGCGAWAAAAGRLFPRPQGEPKIEVATIIIIALAYGVFFFSMGDQFLPGHAAWATLLLWASALLGALIANQLYLPKVIGMLSAGLLLRNIPWAAVDAFPPKWGVQFRAAALATIFLRCGLELDFGTMRRFKYPAMRLALVPGLAEAFYDGGIAVAVFNMPALLAFTMGFILKAVGPGLVVPAMFQLQKTGLGRDQGIPSTVVIAASFDDVIAITGYSIFSSVAITGQGNVAWQIASGPLQVIFGIAGGLLAGLALGCTRLFNTGHKRLAGLYFSALLLMFFLEYWNLLSGGALGALFVGLVASNAWEKGVPKRFSLGRSFVYSPEIERAMAILWTWVWEPLLFVTIGASIEFATLDGGIIPRSLLIVCTGVTLRLLVTYVAMMGFGYNWQEKLFYSLAWTPKATVQAALSGAPLALIKDLKCDDPTTQECIDYTKWGNDILVTGVFAIIVCGTLGVIAIHLAAPRLLAPAEDADSEGSVEGEGAADDEQQQQRDDSALPPPPPDEPAAALVHVAARPYASTLQLQGSGAAGSVHAQVGRRPGSTPNLGAKAAEQASRPDHELLATYLDAIRQLTDAVHDDSCTKADLAALSDRVLDAQRRVEAAMEHREPSVRELFRTATRLAQTFVVRPHHGPAAAGGGMVRSPSAGSMGSGDGVRRRSTDARSGSALGRARSSNEGAPAPGGAAVWPDGARRSTSSADDVV